MPTGGGMRIGFIEPHLRRGGSARRTIELANRLTDRGHQVTIYLPGGQELGRPWPLPLRAGVRMMPEGFGDELDVVVCSEEAHWHLLDRFGRARRRVFQARRGQRRDLDALLAPVDLQIAVSGWTADRVEEV